MVAVGYAMVYGVLKFINFAHGDIAMVGAYVAFFLMGIGLASPGTLTAVILIAGAACALLGVLIDRIAYKPLRRSSRLTVLITAIGISQLLQAIVILVGKAEFRTYPLPEWKVLTIGDIRITTAQLITLLVAVAALAVLRYVVQGTKLGAHMRAVADNQELAITLGLPVDRVISVVFAIGSGMAALAGILFGLQISISPVMGFDLGIKAFAAVVLGGIGNLPGAVVGALIIGVAENFTDYFIGGEWKEATAFLVMILVLLVRPSGLFGGRSEQVVKL